MRQGEKTAEKKAAYSNRVGSGSELPGLSIPGMPTVMDTKELAAYLRLNPYTVVKKAEKGELPAFKIGRNWRFRSDDIDNWMRGELEKANSFPQKVDRVFKKIRLGLEKAGYSARDVERLIQEVRSAE